MGIVVDLHSPDWGRNPMGIIQARIALRGVLPCRGPGYVCLLRTQPHSCRRGRTVWPCGCILHWHGYVRLLRPQPHSCRSVAVWTHPPPVAHCGHTALYVIYVGADSAGPPHTQALGEWPLRHCQTFISQ